MTAPESVDMTGQLHGEGSDVAGRSVLEITLRRFTRQRLALLALGFLVLIIVAALFAPLITFSDPNAQDLGSRLEGPSSGHILGTDDLGRDEMTRLLFAARTSLLAAAIAVGVAILGGVPIGLLAGYQRGPVDVVASRFADAVISIPALVLALAIVGILEPNLTNAMLAIGIVYAPRLYRVVRASSMEVRELAFIEAARVAGTPTRAIVARHVLPSVLSPLIVQVSLALGFAIIAEASLSFLGLGVQPPQASWGTMLGRSTRFMEDAPHLVILPGLLITVTVLALNVVGDGLRDSLGRELREAE